MRRDVLRRVRWGNVSLACTALAALSAIVVWPVVATSPRALPPDTPRPLVAEEPRGAGWAADSATHSRDEGDGESGRSTRRREAAGARGGVKKRRERKRVRTARNAGAKRGGDERAAAERRAGAERGGDERPAAERRAQMNGGERTASERRADAKPRAPVDVPSEPRRDTVPPPAPRQAAGGEFGFEGSG
jgi:hypothetical protein